MSWVKPGSVPSSEPTAPPARLSFASRTITRRPARARTHAATSPFGPDPMTTASGSLNECGNLRLQDDCCVPQTHRPAKGHRLSLPGAIEPTLGLGYGLDGKAPLF